MSGVTIRRLGGEDAAAYGRLRVEAIVQHPRTFAMTLAEAEAMTAKAWAERLTKDYVWGAVDATGRFGGCLGMTRKTGAFAHIGKLFGLYVAPQMRGQSVGRRLYATAEYVGRQIGLRQITMAVAVHNASARKLYDAWGYQVYGVEPAAMYLEGAYVDEELRMKVL